MSTAARHVDIFNGDADGICALIQLRLSEPLPEGDAPGHHRLVTGVKRDNELLAKADVRPGDVVTVLDVSMDKNTAPLVDALAKGCRVFYVDHHHPGDVPRSENLVCRINESPDVNTSLLVNEHLGGKHPLWAVVGAFGDNVLGSARKLAAECGLSEEDTAKLEHLGTLMNYNGYGPSEEDLHFRPADLYRHASKHVNPLDFIARSPDVFRQLADGYAQDMGLAASLEPVRASPTAAVIMLPDERWARRVSGVYSNDLVNLHPGRAHAVISPNPPPKGGYTVSVRAPLERGSGAAPAHELVRKFPTGGGRAAAAGINVLPQDMLEAFIEAFMEHYGGGKEAKEDKGEKGERGEKM